MGEPRRFAVGAQPLGLALSPSDPFWGYLVPLCREHDAARDHR